ncbi:MAG: hypothetical protein KBS56_05690 [Clostridiales bacterium]|nr:hypothetical protein [Candidatus Crickella equi]
MKKKSYILLVPLLLVVLMALSACAQEQYSPYEGETSTLYELTYNMYWTDDSHFITARVDGTMSIYEVDKSNHNEITLIDSFATPEMNPITTLAKSKENEYIVSDGTDKMSVFTCTGSDAVFNYTLSYDTGSGPLNSGTYADGYFISGHENGDILFWKDNGASYTLEGSLSLQSSKRLDSPYDLHNIRCIQAVGEGKVVTCAEDGDICLVDVNKREIINRIRYRNNNPKRGMNYLYYDNGYLLTTNCTVGKEENLNLYKIENDDITMLDSIRVVHDTGREDVLSNTVYLKNGKFLVATSEGYIFSGIIDNNKLTVQKYIGNGTDQFAPIFSFNPETSLLAYSLYDISVCEMDSIFN